MNNVIHNVLEGHDGAVEIFVAVSTEVTLPQIVGPLIHWQYVPSEQEEIDAFDL